MECFICSSFHETVRDLMGHLRTLHKENYRKGPLVCPFKDCTASFDSSNTYGAHLRKLHKRDDTVAFSFKEKFHTNKVSVKSTISDTKAETVHDNKGSSSLNSNENLDLGKDLKLLRDSFVLNSYNKQTVNSKEIHSHIADSFNLLCTSLNSVELFTQNCLEENSVSPEIIDKILSQFEEIRNVFVSKSQYKVTRDLESAGLFIKPVPFLINQKQANDMTPKAIVGHQIPISSTIRAHFSIPGVLNMALEYMGKKRNPNILEDYKDGTHWDNIKANFQGKIVFPIFLYFDDAEICDPLGSSSGKHKLGFIYFTLKCFPPKFLSVIKNIFVAAIFHSKHRSKYGNKRIFRPLMQQLKSLEDEGLEIFDGSKTIKIYFCLALIIGDNLGMHSILGFVESFSAIRTCHICNIEKELSKKSASECPDVIRNKEMYEQQAIECDVRMSGIKEPCVFNSLKSFHAADNHVVDIMHDMLEGTLNSELALIIEKFISEGYFSLVQLNRKIRHFRYPHDFSKPPVITNEHLKNGKLKMSASQMLTFAKTFRFLVGDKVPVGSLEWQLYLLNLEILDIILDKDISIRAAEALKNVIYEHHSLYIQLFGDLKPKHHHETHYVYCILKYGPLSHLWSMRFEAKHSIMKDFAKQSRNKKNITLTIARRYQLYSSQYFKTFPFTESETVTGKKTIKNLKDIKGNASLKNLTEDKVHCTKFIQTDDLTLKEGDVIFLECNEQEGISKYGKVCNIICIDNTFTLCLRIYKTVNFNDHFNCYCVMQSNQFILKQFNKSLKVSHFFFNNGLTFVV